MASTYSPKLRFELIGAGEQAGLWGTTTNKNVGQLIEQAIAGVTTVELDGLSGNYTLTALDGAPDQSRSAVILCTYAAVPASAGINLIIPAQTKLYVIRNDCGQTVTVKTSAQVGGVIILNGESTLVFCDGSDALAGIETAAVGTLTVSGGGTGTTTFGGGGFVKSPGGTGSLTASSTVNAATELSNQVPVANGGTGASSLTLGRVLLGNGTSAVNAYAGISTNDVLTWNGTAWVSQAVTASGVSSLAGTNIGVSSPTGAVTISLNSTNVTNALGYTPYNASSAGSMASQNANSVNITGGSISGVTLSGYAQTGSANTFTQNQRINVSGSSILYLGSGSTGIQWDGSAIGVGIVGGAFWAIYSAYIESNQADVRKPGGGPFNASVSDARLKDNVVNYTQGLNAIKQLRPVNYNLNDVTKLGAQTNYKTFTGLIAQEVQETDLSNMVIPGMEGYLTLDVSELTYTLVNAVKELSAQVDALKAEVAALKGA